jgi:hypothetical protein
VRARRDPGELEGQSPSNIIAERTVMSSTMKESFSRTSNEPMTSVVDTVFDTTLGWVDAGLAYARSALSNAARTLIRAARTIEIVRERLRS